MKKVILEGTYDDGREFFYCFNAKLISEYKNEVKYELVKFEDDTFWKLVEFGKLIEVSK
jgi:hypothetical protein